MIYNSKKVWDEDDFEYSKAAVGDYVTAAIVVEAMNALPPACMRSSCMQLGEPYSHKKDPATGEWRATYATFKKVDHYVWQYCGHCFRGENTERGI